MIIERLDLVDVRNYREASFALTAGTTVVVIGHRLSTFAAVDKLLVLVDGAVQHWGGRSEILDKITRRKFHSVPPVAVPSGREPALGDRTGGVAGQ